MLPAMKNAISMKSISIISANYQPQYGEFLHPITLLADLEEASCCSTPAEVHLLRFWEARIVSQDSDALTPIFFSNKSLGVLGPSIYTYLSLSLSLDIFPPDWVSV